MTRLQRLFSLFVAFLMTSVTALPMVRADQIGFIEKYALAEDRHAVLESLIPGSDDYYFFHCLHYQVTGDLNRAEAMLVEWETKNPNDTALRISVRDRQRLLTYGAAPQRTIDYLRDRLSIELNHAAPPQAGQRRWPDSLDQSLVDPANLLREAARNRQPVSQLGLAWLAEKALAGEVSQYDINLEWLTQQISGRWYGRLGELVIAELKSRRPENRAFGDRAAHGHLTLDELQSLISVFPDFANNRNLINQILLRMRPSEDKDIHEQPEVRFQYLTDVYNFVQTLPASQNSLKAASLYRLLEAHMMRGDYPQDLFLQYLKLPRLSPIIVIDARRIGANQANAANLNEDFNSVALLPPIRDEQPLVRAFLEHFLRDAPSTAQFDGLVEKDYLNRVFAETKLLYGVGQPQQWFEMLTTAQRQQLTDSVELTLSPENPRFLSSDKAATIQLDVKGIDELIVRVYEINTLAYYRTRTDLIDTNIDLDGLIATSEERYEYKLPKIRRHRETISIPTVEGRGVWIVDFLGGGLRSRAILRRGDLRFIERQTASGQVFTILNEDRSPVTNARMLIAGQELVADDAGQIVVPPVDQALTRNVVIADDEIAVPLLMVQYGEQYSLKSGMMINREQLLSGQTAELIIRPRLYLASTAVAPEMLEQVSVTVTATDQDGIATTRKFENLTLSQTEETTVKFRVPNRLANLDATLAGQITTLATGRVVQVQDVKSWEVNASDSTSNTMDIHLTRDGKSWIAEVRGLNGEPVAGVMVQLTAVTRYRDSQIDATLETDDQGRITLGLLEGVKLISLAIDGNSITRSLETAFAYWPQRIQGVSGEAITLPLPESINDADTQARFRIVELRSGQPAKDVTANVLKIASGQVLLNSLSPGDYRLYREDAGTYSITHLAITEGPVVSGIAAGEIRNLELQWPNSLAIANVETSDNEVVIQLSGDLELARVHVFGRRYLPELDSASLPLPPPGFRKLDLPESGYVSDLRLGDEYLYVLRRQYAKKYPGVMLPQPSLLIAPWVTDETKNDRSVAQDGEALPPSAAFPSPASEMSDRAARDGLMRQSQMTQSLEFLGTHGVVFANLQPDKDGSIRIPRENLKGLHLVEIVAVDPFATVRRMVAYPLNKLEPKDRRLANPLPTDKPFAFEREVLVAGPKNPIKMSTLGAAQFQIYTELRDVLQLYQTISGDARLNEFSPLGRWHALEQQVKQDLYGRLACHELHIFLKYKDPEFFESVVRPYLANKKEKKLVDDWLLGNDLSPYTDLWRYVQLNAFEKALLAHAVPEMRATVLRELNERVALQKVDPAQLRQLIDVGLAGRALIGESSVTAGLYFGEIRGESQEAAAMGQAFGYGGAAPGFGGGFGGDVDAFAADPEAMTEKAMSAEGEQDKQRALRRGRGVMSKRAGNLGRMQFFQQLDATKQWAENHWDFVRTSDAGEALIPVDPFWLEWAQQDSASPIISTHLLRPSSNRHAALVALALLDLPFESKDVQLPSSPDDLFQPQQSVAIITKQLRELTPTDEAASLLVGQRFQSAGQVDTDPFSETEEVRIAPEEFVSGQAYQGQIVLTNPTPRLRQVEVFWQIPAGSLPLAGSQATDSRTVQIAPFEVQRIDYQFYFPQSGDFQHYPVCISNDAKVVARGEPRTFNVVSSPTKIDEASWEQVARTGDATKIKQFLEQANLRKLDLSLVAHRLRDRAIYDAIMPIVESARLWQPDLWAYSFLYRDQPRMSTYLEQRSDLVQSVGPVLQSEILVVQPIQRVLYEHLEYAPLVPDRIHGLHLENEIMNDRFLQQYRSLMNVIAFQSELKAEQQLALCYYLLLQNRIADAIDMFAKVDRESIEMTLQYDYMQGYLALHQADYELASQVAAKHLNHPVPRWKERFGQLQSQLQQRRDLLSGSKLVGVSPAASSETTGVREDAADLAVMDRQRRIEQGATASPDVQVRIDGDALVIDHRNTTEATIHFYGIDLELLFSKTPFVRQGLEKMAMVRPSTSQTVTLGDGDGTARYPLNENLSRQTLLVEVVSGSARDTTLYYGGRLKTYVSEGFGQLQVSDRSTGTPVSTAYVKVYSRSQNGEIRFYKDGYTDLRGRFDYATISAGNLNEVERFALLVMHPELGATLHEVAPPTK